MSCAQLDRPGSYSPGRQFIPRLRNAFSVDGPNGRHTCLVQESTGSSLAKAEDSSDGLMFPPETARSIAAQLIMGVEYLHSKGICHGGMQFRAFDSLRRYSHLYHLDLRLGNILLREPHIGELSPAALAIYQVLTAPIQRVDGSPVSPHALPHAVYPLFLEQHADKLTDPVVLISGYGTCFAVDAHLNTPAPYLPPEDSFSEPITTAADI